MKKNRLLLGMMFFCVGTLFGMESGFKETVSKKHKKPDSRNKKKQLQKGLAKNLKLVFADYNAEKFLNLKEYQVALDQVWDKSIKNARCENLFQK